jgi:hypothetical protein
MTPDELLERLRRAEDCAPDSFAHGHVPKKRCALW